MIFSLVLFLHWMAASNLFGQSIIENSINNFDLTILDDCDKSALSFDPQSAFSGSNEDCIKVDENPSVRLIDPVEYSPFAIQVILNGGGLGEQRLAFAYTNILQILKLCSHRDKECGFTLGERETVNNLIAKLLKDIENKVDIKIVSRKKNHYELPFFIDFANNTLSFFREDLYSFDKGIEQPQTYRQIVELLIAGLLSYYGESTPEDALKLAKKLGACLVDTYEYVNLANMRYYLGSLVENISVMLMTKPIDGTSLESMEMIMEDSSNIFNLSTDFLLKPACPAGAHVQRLILQNVSAPNYEYDRSINKLQFLLDGEQFAFCVGIEAPVHAKFQINIVMDVDDNEKKELIYNKNESRLYLYEFRNQLFK